MASCGNTAASLINRGKYVFKHFGISSFTSRFVTLPFIHFVHLLFSPEYTSSPVRSTYSNVYLSVAMLTNDIRRIRLSDFGKLIGFSAVVAGRTGNDRHFL